MVAAMQAELGQRQGQLKMLQEEAEKGRQEVAKVNFALVQADASEADLTRRLSAEVSPPGPPRPLSADMFALPTWEPITGGKRAYS
eukprot:4842668-Pyramimonas_sp.AAC.2